jgi:membrane AbrB-like protein
LAAQFFIGLHVGAKYTGITYAEFRHDVISALGYCVIILGISAGFSTLILSLEVAPPIETMLAFSPGGQAEMAVLALVAGADVAYVVTHHVVRIVVVILGAPLFFRAFK